MDKTNWDQYYEKPFSASKFTRKITEKKLSSYIDRYAKGQISITELGGANSCFFDGLCRRFSPVLYTVVDNNALGLEKFRSRVCSSEYSTKILHADVLKVEDAEKADLVYSVGLVEHFDSVGTQAAMGAHFRLCKENGLVIISFPTPTILYRLVRGIAELLGLWAFPDERPIKMKEALPVIKQYGEVLDHQIIWRIFLTQAMFVVKNTTA